MVSINLAYLIQKELHNYHGPKSLHKSLAETGVFLAVCVLKQVKYLCVLFSYRLPLKFTLFWEHFIHFSELGQLLKVISEEKTVSKPWNLTLGNVIAKTQCARQNWGHSYPDRNCRSKCDWVERTGENTGLEIWWLMHYIHIESMCVR